MNVIGQFMEARDDARTTRQKELDAKNSAEAWMLTRGSEEDRVLGFDRWIRARLTDRLNWDWAGSLKAKRIEQCRVKLEAMVLALWRRGWMLDGARLAKHIDALLAAVADYQKRGQVRDFWAYFNASCERYVGQNAEEIQTEARNAGAIIGGSLAKLLQGTGKTDAATLPELLAKRAGEVSHAKEESLRKRLARTRASQTTDERQSSFF